MKISQKRIKTLVVLLLVLFSGYAILRLSAKSVSDHPYFAQHKFLVIAHRGGRSLGPEETLHTFRNAVELGVDVLEMDVRSTKDGHLVILHDDTVTRTTAAAGSVENYTLAELQKLDAAYRWSPDNGRSFPLRGTGIRIPTLAEVFNTFPHIRMNIEIKNSKSVDLQSLCRLIRDHHMTAKVMVASFDSGSLKKFHRRCPRAAIAAGSSEAILFYVLQKLHLEALYSPAAQTLQVPQSHGTLQVVNRRFIEAAHARNLRVHVWTVNDTDSMKRLLKLGVDGIMTDYPQRLIEVLKKQ